MKEALRDHGRPEIFNSDQGAQFTIEAFTSVLKREEVTISMDGRGRAFDNIFVERLWRNVKHEDVYLKGYASMGELRIGLGKSFTFYNGERPHQSLAFKTPDVVYRTATGGGAEIVDKYPREPEESSVPLSSTEVSSGSNHRLAPPTKAQPGQRRAAAIVTACAA